MEEGHCYWITIVRITGSPLPQLLQSDCLSLKPSHVVIWQKGILNFIFVVVVQLLTQVQLFIAPWTVAHQASLFFSISWSLLKLMSIESIMPSNNLILCCPLLLLWVQNAKVKMMSVMQSYEHLIVWHWIILLYHLLHKSLHIKCLISSEATGLSRVLFQTVSNLSTPKFCEWHRQYPTSWQSSFQSIGKGTLNNMSLFISLLGGFHSAHSLLNAWHCFHGYNLKHTQLP